MRKAALLFFLVIFIDQASKFWIKLNMRIGEEFKVLGDWFVIHFVENPGMAFGLELGGDYGKMALSLFRIVAVIGLCYYIYSLHKEKAPQGVLMSFALITAGALGNIIDSVFYGKIFSYSSYHSVAKLFPDSGGYGDLLHGKVVDMLYFPLVSGTFPDWLPFIGGDFFMFFRPVFNVADAGISIGVGMLLLFYRSYYTEKEQEEKDTGLQEDSVEATS